MIARLHGPDGVALVAEGLGGVLSDTWVNEQGLIVSIDNKGAYVVVIMALVVMATLHGHIEIVATGCHDLQIAEPYIL